MKPSLALELHREDIRRIVERNDARNPRSRAKLYYVRDRVGKAAKIKEKREG